jgi:transposase InsO family protein
MDLLITAAAHALAASDPLRALGRMALRDDAPALALRGIRKRSLTLRFPHLFANLGQVQAITDQWLLDYNQYRPHESLGGLPPVQFMPRLTLAPIVYQPMST